MDNRLMQEQDNREAGNVSVHILQIIIGSIPISAYPVSPEKVWPGQKFRNAYISP